MAFSFGILTISDSCFRQEKEDASGGRLKELVALSFPSSAVSFEQIVPDEVGPIVAALDSWVAGGCDVILTTGGTGLAARDVTPEATRAVIEREASGIALALMCEGLSRTPLAALSRGICGCKATTLIINLPGSPRAVDEYFPVVARLLPHAVALLKGDGAKVGREHSALQKRPAAACAAPLQPSKVVPPDPAARARHSPYPLIEVDEALNIIFDQAYVAEESEPIPIEQSLHRVLGEDVRAAGPVPPFDASLKDGYAVVAADGPGRRRVRGAIAAGDAPIETPLQSGEAVRISTGAPVPTGADAVIQIEDTNFVRSLPGGAEEIEIKSDCAVTAGKDVRRAGTDIPAKAVVLLKHDRISAAHIGVMASLGVSNIRVFKRLSVGVISTGNEVVGHLEQPKPGQIRDSNKLTIINLLRQYNFTAADCGSARDDANSLKRAFERALFAHDMIITTGGVSMGEFDLVKQVLIADFSAVVHFGRVNMKPGKPTTFATLKYNGKQKIVFALPGNPASATVTCTLFVVQTLRFLERANKWKFPVADVYIKDTLRNDDIRPDYVRVKVHHSARDAPARLMAAPTGNQISSRLNSMVGCNGLMVVPPRTEIAADYVKTFIISDVFGADDNDPAFFTTR